MAENFNDVTAAFAGWEQPLDVQRREGSYINGRWVEVSTLVSGVVGVVQNANAEDLKALPEGLRTEEAIKIHTRTALLPQRGEDVNGDIITYNGFSYLVRWVAARMIGGYYKAVAVRQWP